MKKSDKSERGWRWLIEYKWWNLGTLDKIWYANQIERFERIFELTDEERKNLRHEIAMAGLRDHGLKFKN